MSLAPPPPPVSDDDRVRADPTGVIGVSGTGVSWWKLGALGATALAGCAYVALYDPSSSSALYPACPFKVLTGLDCPGCGVTRALHALFTGNPLQALEHNALFVVALPFLLFWAVRGALTGSGDRARAPNLPPRPAPAPATRRWTPTLTWALVALVGVFWVVRNLPWAPFDWLASGLL